MQNSAFRSTENPRLCGGREFGLIAECSLNNRAKRVTKQPSKHIYNSAANMWISFIRRAGLWEFFMLLVRHFSANSILKRLPAKTFVFDGETLQYFYAKYNITWVTERVLEVPIGLRFLELAGAENALEVGNVLGHYIPVRHTVLDKFERGEKIINEDIVTFNPGRTYDLIVSISTFEHIGYEDDGDPDAEKIRNAIAACQRLLSSNGKLIVTVPFGYNPYMDRYIAEDKIKPDRAWFFEKTSKLDWKETTKEAALKRKYAKPYPFANAIMVAEFRSK
jgi:hypothetical protein